MIRVQKAFIKLVKGTNDRHDSSEFVFPGCYWRQMGQLYFQTECCRVTD